MRNDLAGPCGVVWGGTSTRGDGEGGADAFPQPPTWRLLGQHSWDTRPGPAAWPGPSTSSSPEPARQHTAPAQPFMTRARSGVSGYQLPRGSSRPIFTTRFISSLIASLLVRNRVFRAHNGLKAFIA